MVVNDYQTLNTYLHKRIKKNIHAYRVNRIGNREFWRNFNEKVYMQTGEFGEDFWDICEYVYNH